MRHPAFPRIAGLALSFALSSCAKFQDTSALKNLDLTDYVELPDTVTIQIKNYCPAVGRTFKHLFVSNFSVKVAGARNLLDTDADGVQDETESRLSTVLNILPAMADTNADGFGDLFIHLAGIDRTQAGRLRCLDKTNSDTLGTNYLGQLLGLNRCEKEMMKLDPVKFDSDGDGIPDYLEMRCGLNPRDPQDALADTDGDGLVNLDECKRHTPLNESNRPQGIQKLEYKYSQSVSFETGKKCVTFTIGNISILNGGSLNLIAMHLVESDGGQVDHLYDAYELLNSGSSGKTFILDFGPSPGGRFTAK